MLFRTSLLLLFSSLTHHTLAQSETPSSTVSPSPSPVQDCQAVASSKGAGRYSKNFDCGAGGGKNAGKKGKTHFMPKDDSPPPAQSKLRLLMGRQDSLIQTYDYQSAPGIIDSYQLSSLTGGIINTFDTSANLNGNPQVVLSQGERSSVFSNEQIVRRSLYGRSVCNTSIAPIELYSGLGNKVTIVEANIPYDGGIIHITDGFFTVPSTLSDTLTSTASISKFSSYLTGSNSSLDNAPSITVFVPNDDAFLAKLNVNITLSPGQVGSFLNAHIIEGFAAYSPLLVSGASYKTASGARINISTTPEGIPIINENATLIKPDIVIANGVVHVIDQLLSTPTSFSTPPPPVFTGAAGLSPLRNNHEGVFGGVMWTVFLGVGVALFGAIRFGA